MVRQATRAMALAALLAALVPRPALAQEAPAASPALRHLFEYWFGPTAVASGFDGTVATDYATSLNLGQSQGRTTQTITLGAPWHLGVEGGIGVFPTRHAGFQIRFDYVNRELSGTSGPVHAALGYTAAPPPDFIPVQYRLDTSTAWPPPTGTSTELTLALEGAARWSAGTRLSGSVSAGLVYFRAKGTVDSAAYTRYFLGGHSVLFSPTYAMTLAYGTASALGFDLGGGLAAKVAGPLDLMADLRYFHAGVITPGVRVTGFADPSQAPGDLGFNDVSSRMSPIKARVDPSFFRIFFGVRVRS